MTIELVIFDMDGVIFEGRNFWLDLHRRYSTEVEALELAERYLKSDYETLARITADGTGRTGPRRRFSNSCATVPTRTGSSSCSSSYGKGL